MEAARPTPTNTALKLWAAFAKSSTTRTDIRMAQAASYSTELATHIATKSDTSGLSTYIARERCTAWTIIPETEFDWNDTGKFTVRTEFGLSTSPRCSDQARNGSIGRPPAASVL